MTWRLLRVAAPVLATSGPALHGRRLRRVSCEARPGPAQDGYPQRAEIQQQARWLQQTYFPAYVFPKWVCDHYLGENFDDYESDAGASTLFYDEGDSLGRVIQLATEREPVNIGMRRMYNQALLASHFGWQTGAYGADADSVGGLPPNIAIMCPTPVIAGLSQPSDELSQEQLAELKDTCRRVYVLSVIAYAFDSARQPDQAYFLQGGSSISEAKRQELTERFGQIFDKVFAAALHYGRTVLVISKFGAGAFAENYPGDLFEEVWLPAFEAALAAWKEDLRKGEVREISLMGGERSEVFSKAVQKAGFLSELYTFFPDPLRKQLGRRLPEAMIVNAWDSWSLIGNGNFADRSLDGFVGRATALAVLGWPVTNPWLRKNTVPVRRPSRL